MKERKKPLITHKFVIALSVLLALVMGFSALSVAAEGVAPPDPVTTEQTVDGLQDVTATPDAEPLNEPNDDEGVPTFYKVTFLWLDVNGNAVSYEQDVQENGAAIAPVNVSAPSGKVFAGWDVPFDAITGELTVNAVYNELAVHQITINYITPSGVEAPPPAVFSVAAGNPYYNEVPSPFIEGYKPDKPTVKLALEIVSEDMTIDVTYEASDEVKYVIEYYQETLDPEQPNDLVLSIVDYGKTGDLITPAVNEYEGFTAPDPMPEADIASDGSTVIRVLYTRNTYTITFDTGENGSLMNPISALFETMIDPETIEEPTRPGYEFTGWSHEIPETMPAKNMTISAEWREGEADYSVQVMLQNPNSPTTYEEIGKYELKGTVGTNPTDTDDLNTLLEAIEYEENKSTLKFPTYNLEYKWERFFNFNLEQTKQQNASATIKGNGSTVYRLYIDRVLYYFKVVISGHTAQAMDRVTKYDNTYYMKGADGTIYKGYGNELHYTFSGRLGSSVSYPDGPKSDSGNLVFDFFRTNATTWRFGKASTLGSNIIGGTRGAATLGQSAGNPVLLYAVPKPAVEPTTVTSKIKYRYETLNPSMEYPGYPYTHPFNGDLDSLFGLPPAGSKLATEGTYEFKHYYSESNKNAIAYSGSKTPLGIVGFTQRKGDDYVDIDVRKSNEFHTVNGLDTVYYVRNRYSISVQNVSNPQSWALVPYGSPLSWYLADNYEPLHPNNNPSYEFDKWYTTPNFKPGTELNLSTATMPDGHLNLYAKWKTKEQSVMLDPAVEGHETMVHSLPYGKSLAEMLTSAQIEALKSPDTYQRPGYTFGGWRQEGRNAEYDFSLPVLSNLKLKIHWIPKADIHYTIYYYKQGTTEALSTERTVTDGVMGTTIVEKAKLIPGYLPTSTSKSHVLDMGENTIIFEYKPLTTVDYTVRFVDANGKELMPQLQKTTNYNQVVENYVGIDGYQVADNQITLPLSTNVGENVITFVYTKFSEANYSVKHYLQNRENPATYTLKASEVKAADIGASVTGTKRSYRGYHLNNVKTMMSAEIKGDNTTELVLYYDLDTFQVEFIPGDGGTFDNNGLFEEIYYGAKFSESVIVPEPVANPGYTFDKWQPALPADASVITGHAEYKALFVKDPAQWISIQYNGNGGKGTMTGADEWLIGNPYKMSENQFERSNYTFNGWNTKQDGTGTRYLPEQVVSLNEAVTLYAQWKAIETGSTPVTPASPAAPGADVTPPVVPGGTAPAGEGAATPAVVAAAGTPIDLPAIQQQNKEVLNELKESGVPSMTFSDNEVPLFGFENTKTWALMNLMLALFSLIYGVILSVVWIFSKRYSPEESKGINPLFGIPAIIMGVISIAVFFLTQDMRLLMVLTDKWTIVLSLIIAGQITFAVLGKVVRGSQPAKEEKIIIH